MSSLLQLAIDLEFEPLAYEWLANVLHHLDRRVDRHRDHDIARVRTFCFRVRQHLVPRYLRCRNLTLLPQSAQPCWLAIGESNESLHWLVKPLLGWVHLDPISSLPRLLLMSGTQA
jgi:hypothetical protein